MFFKKSIFGLDIYDNSIKVAELSGNSFSADLASYGSFEIEKGIIENGRVLNKDELIHAISFALSHAQPKPISSKHFIFALPESKVFLHILDVPKNSSNPHLYIRQKIAEFIPFDLSEVYDDYITTLDKGETVEILYAAAQKHIVNEFLEVFQAVGIKPLSIEFESAAISRALFAQCNISEGYLLVDIGGRTTILSIYDFCGIRFTENISIAGNSFTEAIMKKWNIVFSEAEKIKKTYGLNPKTEEGKVMLVLQKLVQNVIIRMKEAIDYYQSQSGRKIKGIMLCGGSSLMSYLPQYLQNNLGIGVYIGNPLTRISKDSQEQFKEGITASTVMGLALRGLEKKPKESGINLIKNV